MIDCSEVPPDVERWPDGLPILVMRHPQPAVAIALAKVAVEHNSLDALKEAVESEPLMFVGFLVRRGGVAMAVDRFGKNGANVESGDIFLSPVEIKEPEPKGRG